MREIDPEIREYIKRINSYSGVRTRYSCQGHAEFRETQKRIIVLEPERYILRPYVTLHFADFEKFAAFLIAIVKKAGKGISVSIEREKECSVARSALWGYPRRRRKLRETVEAYLKKHLEEERKLVFGSVLEALEGIGLKPNDKAKRVTKQGRLARGVRDG